MPPIRTPDGDSVGRTADPVGRTAIYSVQGGVAVPLTTLGVDPGTVGQPGGPAGPLDAGGEIPLSQMPIDGLNYQGAWDASTNTPTLADGVGTAGDLYRVSVAGTQDLGSGTLIFEVGDHVIYEGAIWQQLDPAQVIDWGDIQGTLANQADLQAALDAKLDTTDIVGDGPVAVNNQAGVIHVALAPGNDGEAIVTLGGTPTWGNQTANAVGAIATNALGQPNGPASLNASGVVPSGQLGLAAVAASGDYDDLADVPITRLSGTVALQLDGEELIWPSDVTTGKIRLYNSTPGSTNTFYGFGILNQTFAYQVDGSGSTHTFQSVDGSDNAVVLLEISDDNAIVAYRDLHMSEQKVINIADGDAPRDAVNRQQLDTKADAVETPADQTADATLQNQHPTVQLCDATAGAITLSLVADTPGKTFTIKKTDSSANTVTISPPVPIDGQATAVLTSQYDYLTIVRGNADNWHTIASS